MKISELTIIQKGRLAWLLDHKTACGYVTACRAARGELGDVEIIDVFMERGDVTRDVAKVLVDDVINFKPNEK